MSRRLSIAAIVAMLAMAGCDPPTPDRSTGTRLRIFTWWNKEGEAQALEGLEEVHQEAHPNVTFEHIDADSGDDASARLYAVLSRSNNPPDTFNINGGSRLLSHVVSRDENGPVTLQQLKPLDELEEKIRTKVWDFVHPLVEYNQDKYGVPLNLHRINNLYFNVRKLNGLLNTNVSQIEEFPDFHLPKTAKGFVELAKQFFEQRQKQPSVGLGLGSLFMLETLAFENLMPSVAISAEDLLPKPEDRLSFYEAFWKGEYTPPNEHSRTIIDRTLRLAQDLWPCVETKDRSKKEPTDAEWSDSLDALLDEASPVVFVVMGDWATGYLKSQIDRGTKKAFELGPDFGFLPFPGTEPLFIFTTDTLPLPLYADHPDDAKDFLQTALSEEAQIAFNREKGSIPAVMLDVPLDSDWKPNQIKLIGELTDGSLHTAAAISGLLSPDIGENVFRDALKQALEVEDPVNGRDIMHHAFDNNYWLLSRWAETLGN